MWMMNTTKRFQTQRCPNTVSPEAPLLIPTRKWAAFKMPETRADIASWFDTRKAGYQGWLIRKSGVAITLGSVRKRQALGNISIETNIKFKEKTISKVLNHQV